MKKIFGTLLAMLLLSSNAYADSKSRFYWQKEKLEKIAEMANVGNGDASVGKFYIKGLDLDRELKGELIDANEDYNEVRYTEDEEYTCRYEGVIGRRNAITHLESDLDDSAVAEEIEKLYEKRRLIGAYTIFWDGESGDSEYCLTTRIVIFGIDGSVLYLDYDYTT